MFNLFNKKNKKKVELLNQLITLNIDRMKGFDRLGKLGIEYPNVMVVVAGKSMQSSGFIEEIKAIIFDLKGKYQLNSSTEGVVFRVWMNLKNIFNMDDYNNMLMNCEFGEKTALKIYDEILQELAGEISEENMKVLQNQRRLIYAAINELRDLYRPLPSKGINKIK